MPPSIAFDFVTTCIPPTSKSKDDTMELTTLVNLYPGLLLPANVTSLDVRLDFLRLLQLTLLRIIYSCSYLLFIQLKSPGT